MISREQLTVPSVDQLYFETRDKFEGLCRVLDIEDSGKYIIFCRTKKMLMTFKLHYKFVVIWLVAYMVI